MKYSHNFNGWLGKIADDFTYKQLALILSNLSVYYKKNSTPGQKLVIGYDGRFLSKEFAEFASCYMADNGVKVFLSNKPAPSGVLVIAAKAKKSLGTITFTGDEHECNYLGIRAFDALGNIMSEEFLFENKEENDILIDNKLNLTRFINKRAVELFDPGINYNRYIENKIDFSQLTNINKIFFNPVFGSSQFYFDSILHKRLLQFKVDGLKGYTMNNDHSTTIKELKDSSFSLSSHNEQFGELFLEHACDIGFMVSPDASRMELFLKDKSGDTLKLKKPSTTELINIVSHYFIHRNLTGKVILSDSLSIRKKELEKLPFDFMFVKDNQFYSKIKENEFIIAIDSFKRFYLFNCKTFDAVTLCYLVVDVLNNQSQYFIQGGLHSNEQV